MQIKARLIEIGIQPSHPGQKEAGFATLQVSHDQSPLARPVRIPIPHEDLDTLRALSLYLHREVTVTIAPTVPVEVDFSRDDIDLAAAATDLAKQIAGHDIQPGATQIVQLCARLAHRVDKMAGTLQEHKAVQLSQGGDIKAIEDMAEIALDNANTANQRIDALTETVSATDGVVVALQGDVENLHHSLDAVKHDLDNVQADLGSVESKLLDQRAAEFERERAAADVVPAPDPTDFATGFGAPITAASQQGLDMAAAAFEGAVAGAVEIEHAPEPGVDTQITPTWIEPALAAIARLPNGEWNDALCATRILVEPIVRADQHTPLHLTYGAPVPYSTANEELAREHGWLRQDVWLLYRPKRPLSGLDVISLRDGVVAFLRAALADDKASENTLRHFQVHAFDVGFDHTGNPPTAVALDFGLLDNEYADLWLTNAESMVRSVGGVGARDHISPHAMNEIVAYLGGKLDPPALVPDDTAPEVMHEVTHKMEVRCWATWSGREVKLLGPNEPLVFDAIETPESTLRAQTIQALRDGQSEPEPDNGVDPHASTPWAGGAVAENGSEVVTAPVDGEAAPDDEPIDEVAAEEITRRRADALDAGLAEEIGGGAHSVRVDEPALQMLGDGAVTQDARPRNKKSKRRR